MPSTSTGEVGSGRVGRYETGTTLDTPDQYRIRFFHEHVPRGVKLFCVRETRCTMAVTTHTLKGRCYGNACWL